MTDTASMERRWWLWSLVGVVLVCVLVVGGGVAARYYYSQRPMLTVEFTEGLPGKMGCGHGVILIHNLDSPEQVDAARGILAAAREPEANVYVVRSRLDDIGCELEMKVREDTDQFRVRVSKGTKAIAYYGGCPSAHVEYGATVVDVQDDTTVVLGPGDVITTEQRVKEGQEEAARLLKELQEKDESSVP
jgi:hypothetical protein